MNFFIGDDRISRGHAFKLFKKRVRLNIAKYSLQVLSITLVIEFAMCGIPYQMQLWMLLYSANAFKSGLDNYLKKTKG